MDIDQNDINEKVKMWIEIAEEDLRLAKHAFSLESNIPYRLICYHAQQCAEKYLKAFLVYHLIDFPYTHSIDVLIKLCKEKEDFSDKLQDASQLTNYAIAMRYPGDYSKLKKEDSVKAVELAEKVRNIIHTSLSKSGYTNVGI
jgi:HEPN domain-containing protein